MYIKIINLKRIIPFLQHPLMVMPWICVVAVQIVVYFLGGFYGVYLVFGSRARGLGIISLFSFVLFGAVLVYIWWAMVVLYDELRTAIEYEEMQAKRERREEKRQQVEA